MRKGDRGKIIEAGGSFAQARANALKHAHIGTGRKLMVILSTEDPDAEEQHWFLVKPEDVPASLLDNDAMGIMVEGELAQPPGSSLWYRAEPLRDYERRAQRTRIAQEKIANGS